MNSITIGDPPNDEAYSYSYDANGNMIQENSDRFLEWNYADKLAFFKREAGGSNPSVWVHHLYDNQGNRIKKIVNKTGGVQEVTVYIDGFYEYSYTKNSGSFDNNRRYNNLHIIDPSTPLRTGGTSKIASVRVGTDADADSAGIPTQLFYVEDHLGNSSVVVQTNGNRFNLEEYYPFGETSFGSYAKKRYRYNGKEKDEHTGLYEYGQRYYAPWLCRFVSVDPVAEDYPFYTSYNYAGNKPITKIDLEGLQESDARPFAQFASTAKSQIKTQVFTDSYTFRNRNKLTKGLVEMSLSYPKLNQNIIRDKRKYDIATRMSSGLVDEAFIGVSPIGGTAIYLSDLYFQYKNYQAQQSINDFQKSYNTVQTRRDQLNLSIDTGLWLKNSIEIADNSGVFDNTDLEITDEFITDVANYGMLIQAGQKELLSEQEYFGIGEGESPMDYQEKLNQAFTLFLTDYKIEQEKPPVNIETSSISGYEVFSVVIPQEPNKYDNQPVEPSKDHVKKP